MRSFSFPTLLTLALAALVFVGCDSSDDTDDGGGGGIGGGGTQGSGSVSVSGNNGSFSGSGYAGFDSTENTFGIAVFDGSINDLASGLGGSTGAFEYFAIVFENVAGVPGEGTYTVGDETSDVFIVYFDSVSETSFRVVTSTGGTVEVTGSSGSNIRGTFSVTGDLIDISDPTSSEAVTLTGNFNAVVLDEDDFPDVGGV
ncbi:MAG: hypothetical protein AAGF99_12375 [Bacteroidota bacterium]